MFLDNNVYKVDDNVNFKILPKLNLHDIIQDPNATYTDISGNGILRGYNEFDFIDSFGENLGTFYDPINDKFEIQHINDDYLNMKAFQFYKRYYAMDIFKTDHFGIREFHCDFEYDIEENKIDNLFLCKMNKIDKEPLSNIIISKLDPELYKIKDSYGIKLYRNNKCLAIFDGLSVEMCA